MSIKDTYFTTLKTWLDALLPYLVGGEDPALRGGLLCPACGVIHGRCHDAEYPFLYMADTTGEKKYLDAARALFDWSENLVCDDGSIYNDGQNDWNGITVFSAIGLVRSLTRHGHLLTDGEKARREKRLRGYADWLAGGITPQKRTNINYHAANALALLLLGRYFGDGRLTALSEELFTYVTGCVTVHGLIYGEGTPVKKLSPRGVHPVDIGYDAEETVPCLIEYAYESGDETKMREAKALAYALLPYLLPDGAWDNSTGTRNVKWTYWGSRTSDGCQAAFNLLGREDSVFAEAAYRNLLLMNACTDGLLCGGSDYAFHGERACIHHAFCHAKVLAQALDEGITEFGRRDIPADHPTGLIPYPETGTLRQAAGGFIADFTAGDFDYMPSGHVSGGAMSLLWHKAYGPVFAAANSDFVLKEAHNQQQTRKKADLGCVCPRVEAEADGIRYSQIYDYNTLLTADGNTVTAKGILCDRAHTPLEGGGFTVKTTVDESGVTIEWASENKNAVLILPVIARENGEKTEGGLIWRKNGATLTVKGEGMDGGTKTVFNLAPGFVTKEARCRGTAEILIQ